MKKTRFAAIAGFALLLALTLAGCSNADSPEIAASASATRSAAAAPPAEVQPLMAKYGLTGMGAVQAIDRLDRLAGVERPKDLMASVRPGELVLSSGKAQYSLKIPDDRFYLSVAPYVNTTHKCFYHSLTTCQGELTGEDVRVQIVDRSTNKLLVEGPRTTFENGFVGFWLPRGVNGTLRVSYGGKTGEVEFSTGQDAPTCLTTLQLT